ncbi:MAG: cyanophycinase [Phycisphaerales bacterium]|nr:MAG: cyanophycinase [Phycisphaerales bacterium]
MNHTNTPAAVARTPRRIRGVAGFVAAPAMGLALLAGMFTGAMDAFAQGYVVAEGGGIGGSSAWADEIFSWMVEKVKLTPEHKPVVAIIGAVPLEMDDRVPVFQKAGAGEVRTIVITKENANDPKVAAQISTASIVFIRGGDQGRYVGWWKGTGIDRAIHSVYDKGGVVAGTSAGCAIQGEVTYDALKNSLQPLQILADAQHENLSLTHGFLGLVPGVIFDTHFTERGRLPRLGVFLARSREDLHANVVGLGVDPRTAVCVGIDGIAEIKGEGTVTVLVLDRDAEVRLEAGKPPSVPSLSYAQLPAGAKYDIKKRRVISWPAWVKPFPDLVPGERPKPRAPMPPGGIVPGDPYAERPDPVALDGSTPELAERGAWYIRDNSKQSPNEDGGTDEPAADASLIPGKGDLPFLISTQTWSERDAWTAMLLGQVACARENVAATLWLDDGVFGEYDGTGILRIDLKSTRSAVLLRTDSARIRQAMAKGPPRTSRRGKARERWLVAIDGARLDLLAPGATADLGQSTSRLGNDRTPSRVPDPVRDADR